MYGYQPVRRYDARMKMVAGSPPPKPHKLLIDVRTEDLCLLTRQNTRRYPEDWCRTSLQNTIYLLLRSASSTVTNLTDMFLPWKLRCFVPPKSWYPFSYGFTKPPRSKQHLRPKGRYQRVWLCSATLKMEALCSDVREAPIYQTTRFHKSENWRLSVTKRPVQKLQSRFDVSIEISTRCNL